VSLAVPDLEISSEEPNNIHLSLVVPTYNERANVAMLVERISDLLDRLLPGSYELILVDDDSPDRTWEYALSLQAKYPQLRVLRRQNERGLSTAVIRGWQVAQGEVLGVIDGDLQHPPDVLGQLYKAVDDGADIAVASRYIKGGGVGSWSGVRQFLSRAAIKVALFLLPEVSSRLSDPMSGYFLIRRAAISNCPLDPVGYKILLEVMGRGKIKRVAEVGYTFNERVSGSSKVTWRQYEEFVRHLLRLRFATGNVPVGALGRFLRFGTVGMSGMIVDNFVLLLLNKILGIDLLPSKVVAVAIAIANNFVWNDLWTFHDAANLFQDWRSTLVRFIRFAIACSFGAVINIGILYLLKQNLGMHLLLANLIAIAVSTAWNYMINLKFNWKTK